LKRAESASSEFLNVALKTGLIALENSYIHYKPLIIENNNSFFSSNDKMRAGHLIIKIKSVE
jgi:hypothetical protein